MTGIAAVVGMSALVRTPTAPAEPVAAAPPAEHHPIRSGRRRGDPPRRNVGLADGDLRAHVSTPVQRAVISRRVAIIHTQAPRRTVRTPSNRRRRRPLPRADLRRDSAGASAGGDRPSLSLPRHGRAATTGRTAMLTEHDKEHGRGHEKHEDYSPMRGWAACRRLTRRFGPDQRRADRLGHLAPAATEAAQAGPRHRAQARAEGRRESDAGAVARPQPRSGARVGRALRGRCGPARAGARSGSPRSGSPATAGRRT